MGSQKYAVVHMADETRQHMESFRVLFCWHVSDSPGLSAFPIFLTAVPRVHSGLCLCLVNKSDKSLFNFVYCWLVRGPSSPYVTKYLLVLNCAAWILIRTSFNRVVQNKDIKWHQDFFLSTFKNLLLKKERRLCEIIPQMYLFGNIMKLHDHYFYN